MKLRNSLLLASAFAGLVLVTGSAAAEEITLEFGYWSDPASDKLFSEMFQSFEAAHPGVKVKPLHILKDYGSKLVSLAASGNAPDVAMMDDETMALNWCEQGVVMDLLPLIKADATTSLDSRLKPTWYWCDHGTKTLGTNSAVETVLMLYNRDAFQRAGVAEPNPDPDHAWDWQTFVADAKKLTIRNDNQVTQWGFSSVNWLPYWLPLIESNGGRLLDPTGTKTAVTDDAFVHVIDEIAKLAGEYRVTPAPLGSSTPDYWSAKAAIHIDGQWALGGNHGADPEALGFTPGVTPLPVFKAPVSLELGGPTVIFAQTKHPKEAWELYKWTTDAEHVLPLLQIGTWMPLQTAWYTHEALISRWADTPAHPYGYRDAVIKYLAEYGTAYPKYYIKNYDKMEGLINQALSQVFSGKQSARNALLGVESALNAAVAGRWDR